MYFRSTSVTTQCSDESCKDCLYSLHMCQVIQQSYKLVLDIIDCWWTDNEDVWRQLSQLGPNHTRFVIFLKRRPLYRTHAAHPAFYTHTHTCWPPGDCASDIMDSSINHNPRWLFDLNKCCLKISEEGADNRKTVGSNMCLTWLCHDFLNSHRKCRHEQWQMLFLFMSSLILFSV